MFHHHQVAAFVQHKKPRCSQDLWLKSGFFFFCFDAMNICVLLWEEVFNGALLCPFFHVRHSAIFKQQPDFLPLIFNFWRFH